MLATTDTPTELVKLRETEAVGVLDQHHRRVRHVHTNLDDRRRHQHVDLAIAEGAHHAVLLRRTQLPVHQAQPQVREDIASGAARTP